MQGKGVLERNADERVYAGIDVSKEWLDVYCHPSGSRLRISNDMAGIRSLKRKLAGLGAVAGYPMMAPNYTARCSTLAYQSWRDRSSSHRSKQRTPTD